MLKLLNVSKFHGKNQILQDINFQVKPGEVVLILGVSGSGKTTFLQIAGFLDKPTSGVVSIDGETNLSDRARAKNIGFVYQQYNLLSEFSASENIAMPLIFQGFEYKKALLRASEVLESISLTEKKDEYPNYLSGGEQQRIAICRALINKPKILLADEPTGNLDPKNADEIFKKIVLSAKENNTSAIIVTHNHKFTNYVDTVYTLKDGKI